MAWMMRGRCVGVALATLALTGAAAAMTGCGLLDVSDPTAIEESELSDAVGAELLRGDVVRLFVDAEADAVLFAGLFVDEFFANPPASSPPGTGYRELPDRRQVSQSNIPGAYERWQTVRKAASVALPKLLAYANPAYAGEVYAMRGFATLQLAEDFCAGFPLHELDGMKVIYGTPQTTDQALTRALADFDSAVAIAVDSARVLNYARIGRARTLLALGRFAEAAAAAAPVPTIFSRVAEFNPSASLYNPLALDNNFFYYKEGGVADAEGINGLDFVSSDDPRIETSPIGFAVDGTTPLFALAAYPNESASLKIAQGLEARLIEAEADLAAGGMAWKTILDGLRVSELEPDLPPVPDPGTPDGRLDVLFRERAFWLFGTGHRLGDLRRLIGRYDRDSETVFPTGPYRLGGTYGTLTSLPFPIAKEQQFSPTVTGCLEE